MHELDAMFVAVAVAVAGWLLAMVLFVAWRYQVAWTAVVTDDRRTFWARWQDLHDKEVADWTKSSDHFSDEVDDLKRDFIAHLQSEVEALRATLHIGTGQMPEDA